MAFNILLERKQEMLIWRSEGPDECPEARELQALFDAGKASEYEARRAELESEGHQFRLTKGKVFQIHDCPRTLSVPIMFQVVDGTLNWYFIAPMDVTKQEDRDELYQSAALGHLSVDDHCERYWRGTNSLHVKKMHTKEEESEFNHNHYRLDGETEATPKHVEQHLRGLVLAQRRMGLIDKDGNEKFLTMREAAKITHQFAIHYFKTHYVGPERDAEVDGEIVHVLAHDVSEIDVFHALPEHKFTPEDLREWEEHRHEESPCVSIPEGLSLSEVLGAISAGMRGLGSELAQTRQIAGSKFKAHATVVSRDDAVHFRENSHETAEGIEEGKTPEDDDGAAKGGGSAPRALGRGALSKDEERKSPSSPEPARFADARDLSGAMAIAAVAAMASGAGTASHY